MIRTIKKSFEYPVLILACILHCQDLRLLISFLQDISTVWDLNNTEYLLPTHLHTVMYMHKISIWSIDIGIKRDQRPKCILSLLCTYIFYLYMYIYFYNIQTMSRKYLILLHILTHIYICMYNVYLLIMSIRFLCMF